jgi:hypothetical protein
MRQRVAFLHLPKSAGSSVRSAITAAAGDDRVAPFQLDRTLFGGFDQFDRVAPHASSVVLTGTADQIAPYPVALGHFALSTLTPVFDTADMFALLREPRARLVSHFSFWRSWTAEQHAVWAPYAGSRVPAERGWGGFLTDPEVASQVDNLMVRLLLCPDPRIPADGFIESDLIDELAGEAIDQMATLGHVDIIDHGPGFWAGLSAWLDTELVPVRENATPAGTAHTDWPREITATSEQALALRTRGDRLIWNTVALRTRSPAQVAALADAAYLSQIARVAQQPTQQPTQPPDQPPVDLRPISRTRRLIAAATRRASSTRLAGGGGGASAKATSE